MSPSRAPRSRPAPLSTLRLLAALVPLLAAATSLAQSALPDSMATPPPAAAAAPRDTLPPVDVDAALRAGQGLILAWEDTISFGGGTLDTILSTAPRLHIEEVVRRIGGKMAAERLALREHSYTALTKIEAFDDEKLGRRGKWKCWETVSRVRLGPDGTYQQARLWQRERKWRGEELREEKVDDDVETHWGTIGEAVVEAIPFSLETGGEYNYEILDRRLAGHSVIYEIRYEPRSEFKALPRGRVWVDLGDWVIRRIEGELTGTVPLPMFLKGIPVYRLRREQKGGTWVVADLYAEVDLRDVPLLGMPDRIRLYYQTLRHVIDGVSYPDEEPAAEPPEAAPAPVARPAPEAEPADPAAPPVAPPAKQGGGTR